MRPSSPEKEIERLVSEPDSPVSTATSSFSRSNTVLGDEEKDIGILVEEPEFSYTKAPRREWTRKDYAKLFFRLLKQMLLPLVPSWYFKRTTPRKLHPTSYLDGLRGIAAFIVFLDHFTLNWYYALRSGYKNTPEDTYWLQLPFLRLIFAGRASVGVFFVISGFVLSYRPLMLLRSDKAKGKVLDTLASSVFRRAFRLYLPLVVGTFISMLLIYMDAYTPVPNRNEMIPPKLDTFQAQFWHWWMQLKYLTWLFAQPNPNQPAPVAYNGHLWTIPIEFQGSIVVFVVVLALAKAKNAMRMILVAGICCWSLSWGRWDVWLFLGGVGLAEWSLYLAAGEEERRSIEPLTWNFSAVQSTTIRIASKLSLLSFTRFLRPATMHVARLHVLINPLLLVISLFLLSYAGESPQPGYYHLFLIPWTPAMWAPVFLGREHFWVAIGSLLLVFCLTNSKILQRPFTTRFAQYLGDISYSLYIVHGLVLFTLGTALQEHWTGQVGKVELQDNGSYVVIRPALGDDGKVMYLQAFIVAGFLCAVVAFTMADLFWRVIDSRCVAVGRWVEGLFIKKERSERSQSS